MKNKPSNFRDRLLDLSVTPELRSKYRRELDSILNHRLTPRSKLAFLGGMIVALVFIVLCLRSFTLNRATTDSMVVAWRGCRREYPIHGLEHSCIKTRRFLSVKFFRRHGGAGEHRNGNCNLRDTAYGKWPSRQILHLPTGHCGV